MLHSVISDRTSGNVLLNFVKYWPRFVKLFSRMFPHGLDAGSRANFHAARWPGKVLAQHPFLFYEKGSNALYVVKRRRVVWTSAVFRSEMDAAGLMFNGHDARAPLVDKVWTKIANYH